MSSKEFIQKMQRRKKKILVYTGMANMLSNLSTCPRGEVGCIITDEDGIILSTGFNGLPSGQSECTQPKEPGACKAIHAEQNALMQCKDLDKARQIFINISPCNHCIKMLSNTKISVIWYEQEYRDTSPLDWWVDIGRQAIKVDLATTTLNMYKR